MNTNRCVSCCSCKCGAGSSSYKRNHLQNNKLVDVNTQTDFENNTITYKAEETTNYEFDFFDNLDRTLKLLSNSKNL